MPSNQCCGLHSQKSAPSPCHRFYCSPQWRHPSLDRCRCRLRGTKTASDEEQFGVQQRLGVLYWWPTSGQKLNLRIGPGRLPFPMGHKGFVAFELVNFDFACRAKVKPLFTEKVNASYFALPLSCDIVAAIF